MPEEKKEYEISREEINKATEDFLKRGGKIIKVTNTDFSATANKPDEVYNFFIGD